MTGRLPVLGAVVVLVGALAAPSAHAEPTPAPPPLTSTPPPGAAKPAPFASVTTLNTDACPHRDVPPPAVDSSEVPKPGQMAPTPLAVPTPAAGGLNGCGVLLPVGAPPAPAGIDSSGWLIADVTAGKVLAAKDPHGRYRPASTIKLLLAQVALRELKLDTVVTGTLDDASQEGDAVGLGPGGRYTVRDLLLGLLLLSGNDCAHALAMQLGGIDATVAKMNALASELGAHDTRAASPSGLDAPGMSTSPYDLALILRAAMQNPTFRELDTTKQAFLPGYPARRDIPGDKDHPGYTMVNENQLLFDVPGALGGKTGYTDDAKKTYAGAVERNGHQYVITQMFGLAYADNTYWDQFNRLLDYALALPEGASVGAFGSTPEGATAAPGGDAAPAGQSASGGHEGMSDGLRWAIGAAGAALVLVLVVAAVRAARGRE
ncbi:serine hydrolase [Tsukamurella sp. 8F]|uniref:D-alanyl-D-alanine carboxypeptidase family protein n=1 Tax=unclassified Tsukamurella TaxID=2633480 RepID=UPI0023BA2892|nr:MULTISPECIES: serine hydrolase [unclassified Tsukamurella]MDF0531840.1 serine hydrolase [Tsukamurella sp. 8J]MDF0589082.1 serine hydrolase [Tsukamurella sp. 8F]